MSKHIYVNVYEETQHYGGAEEGGWFYWAGIPMWTAVGICLCSDNFNHSDRCPIKGFLLEAKAVVKSGRDGYLESFISGDPEEPEYRNEAVYGRRTLRQEEHPGKAYPTQRPHYE